MIDNFDKWDLGRIPGWGASNSCSICLSTVEYFIPRGLRRGGPRFFVSRPDRKDERDLFWKTASSEVGYIHRFKVLDTVYMCM